MITPKQLRIMAKAVAKAQSELAKLKRQYKREQREKRKPAELDEREHRD